jgi:hypothetical protein
VRGICISRGANDDTATGPSRLKRIARTTIRSPKTRARRVVALDVLSFLRCGVSLERFSRSHTRISKSHVRSPKGAESWPYPRHPKLDRTSLAYKPIRCRRDSASAEVAFDHFVKDAEQMHRGARAFYLDQVVDDCPNDSRASKQRSK